MDGGAAASFVAHSNFLVILILVASSQVAALARASAQPRAATPPMLQHPRRRPPRARMLHARSPCGHLLRAAAPPQRASTIASGWLPCAVAPQQRLRRPPAPDRAAALPASQHPYRRGRRGCSPRRHRSLRGHAAAPCEATPPLLARPRRKSPVQAALKRSDPKIKAKPCIKYRIRSPT